MYRNQCYPEKYSLRRGQSSEDYELCNAGHQFIVQWSPRDSGARYLARSRYASPGSLSKSVPRRNRSSLRFGINRSLNFDLGGRARLSNYASPNSSSESNVSTENDHYLSRSAKILRALNIDFSPLKSAALGARRINKSLNFDVGPSPDSAAEAKPTRRASSQLGSLSVSPLARINKTLNFETSSAESSVNSVLESSLEFIDENQNQTPSHQRNGAARKAKKSLDYSSPKFVSSPSSNPSTPMLRSDLRQKIDDIVRQNGGIASATGNPGNKRLDDFGASTPRNLFDELRADEEEDGEHLGRPSTPENFVRIIPESMSAIKKSHKKERVLGRMSKAGYQAVVVYQADARSETQLDDAEMDVQSEDEKRSATPPAVVNDHRYDSPQQCGLKSIKKSHKRDKSKRRSYGASSDDEDDEMSETGSLFEFTSGNEKKSTARLDLDAQVARQLPERNTADGEEPSSRTPVSDEPEVAQGAGVVPSIVVTDLSNVTSTPETTRRSAPRPGTPENRINFLQRVMTDSIKKSHKKVKDTNKRFFFKPRLLNAEAEARVDVAETVPTQEDHRAGTPDNTNSSRLLLSQFSSVKKSHRKDKHRRMLSGSLQRKKYFGRVTASSSDCETHNCSVSSTEIASPSQTAGSDVPGLTNEFSDDSRDAPYCSLQNSPVECPEFGVDALADHHKSSPNKRKNESAIVQAWTSPESKPTEDSALYESAEEEFKIFTPIKKRKSINCIAVPIARRICHEDTTAADNAATVATRCSTPRITRATGLRTSASPEFPATPEGASFVPIADPSSPRQIEPASEPNAGRATPQNLSTAVLMAGINSIKKSHKKDKRGNAATRRPLTQDDEFSVHDNETSSRSRETPSSEAEASAKTPPNCLQAKNYLRLLRTESIKRSHKKVRDRKRRDRVIEPELSDDGSIFDEAERSFDLAEPTERRGCDTPKEHADASDNEMRNRRSGAAAFARHGDNLSDDGSIFDSEEKKYGSPDGGDQDDADGVGAARTDDF